MCDIDYLIELDIYSVSAGINKHQKIAYLWKIQSQGSDIAIHTGKDISIGQVYEQN